jgi:hypothetical protein
VGKTYITIEKKRIGQKVTMLSKKIFTNLKNFLKKLLTLVYKYSNVQLGIEKHILREV